MLPNVQLLPGSPQAPQQPQLQVQAPTGFVFTPRTSVLEVVELKGAVTGASVMSLLRDSPSLTALHVMSNRLSDLGAISSNSLRTLRMSGSPLAGATSFTLQVLFHSLLLFVSIILTSRQTPNLVNLRLDKTELTPTTIASITQHCSQLAHLDLSQNASLHDFTFNHPNLQSLVARDCLGLGSVQVASPQLRFLNLSGARSLEAVNIGHSLKLLSVDLSQSSVEGHTVQQILQAAPMVRRFFLRHCQNLCDLNVLRATSLVELDLDGANVNTLTIGTCCFVILHDLCLHCVG